MRRNRIFSAASAIHSFHTLPSLLSLPPPSFSSFFLYLIPFLCEPRREMFHCFAYQSRHITKFDINYNNNNVFTTHVHTLNHAILHTSITRCRSNIVRRFYYTAFIVLTANTTSITSGTIHHVVFICFLSFSSLPFCSFLLSFSVYSIYLYNILQSFSLFSFLPPFPLLSPFSSFFAFFLMILPMYNSIF